MSKRDIAIEYAKSFLGVPYRWGGETPMGGYDCSGLVQEILASVGLDPKGDQTADALMKSLESKVISGPIPGALVFYGNSKVMGGKATHVGFMINMSTILEASGGGSDTTDLDVAIERKAFVKLRPYRHRTDILSIRDPFKNEN